MTLKLKLKDEYAELAMQSGSFDFLYDESNLYSEKALIKRHSAG